ncbi:hypothetical protein B0I37DRAFT_239745 [Chaetomium sp. MPI-CAGE-AT-0009]|nr:hypothetical protein B0I37DRAFT_239745 [Chaetomium sp. MPI-CAGE-AT-0009]
MNRVGPRLHCGQAGHFCRLARTQPQIQRQRIPIQLPVSLPPARCTPSSPSCCQVPLPRSRPRAATPPPSPPSPPPLPSPQPPQTPPPQPQTRSPAIPTHAPTGQRKPSTPPAAAPTPARRVSVSLTVPTYLPFPLASSHLTIPPHHLTSTRPLTSTSPRASPKHPTPESPTPTTHCKIHRHVKKTRS